MHNRNNNNNCSRRRRRRANTAAKATDSRITRDRHRRHPPGNNTAHIHNPSVPILISPHPSMVRPPTDSSHTARMRHTSHSKAVTAMFVPIARLTPASLRPHLIRSRRRD